MSFSGARCSDNRAIWRVGRPGLGVGHDEGHDREDGPLLQARHEQARRFCRVQLRTELRSWGKFLFPVTDFDRVDLLINSLCFPRSRTFSKRTSLSRTRTTSASSPATSTSSPRLSRTTTPRDSAYTSTISTSSRDLRGLLGRLTGHPAYDDTLMNATIREVLP